MILYLEVNYTVYQILKPGSYFRWSDQKVPKFKYLRVQN